MITFASFLLITLLQFIAGLGIISVFRIVQKPIIQITLCLLLGIAFFSFVPFLLQLFYIPLTKANIFVALLTGSLLLNYSYKQSLQSLKNLFSNFRLSIKIYEIPFLLFIVFVVFISVWRCYYLPPTPRDLLSGPEAIAEYAVKEKTLVNSVFTVDLETTNNQFKPAFITSLQIIYKYAGFEFGQIWLSNIFICFVLFLYNVLRENIHSLLTGFLICIFITIPDMYGYTFLVLFDYCNAVYFFLAYYYLFRYFENHSTGHLLFAGLLMGISAYIRSETLLLACFSIPVLLIYYRKNHRPVKVILAGILSFVLPSVFIYWITVPFYIGYYLPVKYPVGELMNKNLSDLFPLWDRFRQMNTFLIFGGKGPELFGYFIYLFLAAFILELITQRKLTRQGKNWLAAVLIVYFGLPVLGYLLPVFDLSNTTKRGLFKLFPLILLYLQDNKLLINLSQRIKSWELRK